MIDFKCEQCGENMSVPDSLAGQVEKCPYCGKDLSVPGPDPAVAPNALLPPSAGGDGLFYRLASLEPAAWSGDRKSGKTSDTIKTTLSDGLRIRIKVRYIGLPLAPDHIEYTLFVNDSKAYSETVANALEFVDYGLAGPLSKVYDQWFRVVRMPGILAEVHSNPKYQAAVAELKGLLGTMPEEPHDDQQNKPSPSSAGS